MLDAPTERFIAQVGRLPAPSLADAYDRTLKLRQAGGREASRATKPSASENSELEKTVHTTLLPRASELDAFRQSLHAQSGSATMIAARAILKRSKLSVEHYEVLVEPFVAVGVDVPLHPEKA